ncbi:autotransporter-associated beta strand repeat-containing protein, partial [Snodgrassella sp. CFCC 13594]|uniref:autotransporter-associated beta strand repeat-containing protein n=1 Tax=Snodgrassella sp. CFCC 13594 TaxID=1775559 RepID=UPI0018D4A6FC
MGDTTDFGGNTAIDSGSTLQLGNGGTSGNLNGDIANNGVLAFNRSDDGLIIDDVISGSGQVLQNGGGTTTLTGNNTYSGGTKLNKGIIN